jgi:hypothetical protein
MSARLPVVVTALTVATMAGAIMAALIWQPWDSDSSGDSTSMTVEGVIALVSREHAGCPGQPLLVLSADAVYVGDDEWRVTYRGYQWTVNEADRSVEAIGEPLPCPGR